MNRLILTVLFCLASVACLAQTLSLDIKDYSCSAYTVRANIYTTPRYDSWISHGVMTRKTSLPALNQNFKIDFTEKAMIIDTTSYKINPLYIKKDPSGNVFISMDTVPKSDIFEFIYFKDGSMQLRQITKREKDVAIAELELSSSQEATDPESLMLRLLLGL